MRNALLAAHPAVTLATSRRVVIDERGERKPDIEATRPVAVVTSLIPGRELGDLALVNSANYIGEPSTPMFRRAQVELEEGSLFRWRGREYHCLADLSLWLRLLANGLTPTITTREGLEAAACECYARIRDEFLRVLGTT